MAFLPLVLALSGLFVGRAVALMKGECPHRGKVWGSFVLPLFVLSIPGLQFQALAMSLAAAVGSGLTAHHRIGVSFAVVFLMGTIAMLGVAHAGL